MWCANCGGDLERREDVVEALFKGERISVACERNVCAHCGESVFSADEADAYYEALDAEYRRRHGLLSPSQIRLIRETLDLSQKEFEQILGVSSPTVSRWETGAVIQPKMADNFLRSIDAHYCVARDLFERSEVRVETPRVVTSCPAWSVCVSNSSLASTPKEAIKQ